MLLGQAEKSVQGLGFGKFELFGEGGNGALGWEGFG